MMNRLTIREKSLLLIVAGVLYFLSARLGLLLAYENTNASPVWPPAGLGFGLVLIFGRRIWPGIFLGAFAANITVFLESHVAGNAPIIFTSIAIATGNTLEALIGSYLMKRFIGTLNFLEKYQNIFKFIAVAVASAAVSCTIGATSLCISGIVSWNIYSTIWRTWLLGDFSGILVITPLLIVWNANRTIKWKFKGLVEPVFISLCIVFFADAIFIEHYSIGELSSRLYMIVPFLLWMVFRFGHREIISALTIVSAFAIWGTVNGHGPFISDSLNDSLLNLIAFISIITITFMALSASLAESRQMMNELKEHEHELEIKIIERTQTLAQTNVSLLKEIEAKENAKTILEKKTNQLDEAQRMAHIGSWEWNIKTGKEVWSDEQYRVFGYEPKEHDATYDLFQRLLHPQDKDAVLSAVKETLDGTKGFNMEYRIIRRDDIIRHIEAHGEVFRDAEGVAEKMIGTVRDITESKLAALKIKESEERFFKIFKGNPVGMSITNLETLRFEFANEIFLKTLNYSEDEIIGKTSVEINMVRPEEREKVLPLLKQTGSLKDIEGKVFKKNGEEFWVLVSLELIEINGKKYILTSMQDIAARKEMEKNLDIAKKQAEETTILKETFLANMSHEIRTPMNAIVGFVSILSETKLNNEQSHLVSNINTASENLLGIINDILDYSKIEAGMMKIENTVVNLPRFIESVYSIARGTGVEKNLEISLFISPALPEYVICDAPRISQILINLVANAIKFTEKGFVNMNVEVNPGDAGKYHIKFTVSDSGRGIAKENLETIFERFKQEHTNTEPKFAGTGLGLSIVKSIVTLLGGELFVESELGKGSEFIFIIPVGKCTDEQIAKYLDEQNKKDVTISENVGWLNILLVEDNSMNQQYCKMLLTGFGFTCSIVGNGREAIQRLKAEEFDLILMDLQIPVIDGYEATRIIRNELEIATPIIALTANTQTSEHAKCLSMGMNGYLSKPFKPKDLYHLIVELCTSSAQKQNENSENVSSELIGSRENLFDINFVKEQVNGKLDGVRELIEIFSNDTPTDMKELKDAIDNEDYFMIEKGSHKLVSSFAILGVTKAISLLETIENNAGGKKQLHEIENLYGQLVVITSKVQSQISDINFSNN